MHSYFFIMDVARLVALNCYTRREIKEHTNIDIESSIICIGNILERRRIKENIENRIPFILIAPVQSGKYTTVISVCDEMGLEYRDSYDGEGFEDAPYVDEDSVFIIRNPKKSKLIQDYMKTGTRVVLLFDGKPTIKCDETILIHAPTRLDEEKYLKAKGTPMLRYNNSRKGKEEKILVAKSLRRGIPEELMPKTTHRWLARNFGTNRDILKLAFKAQAHVKNDTIYWAMMNKVRSKRSKDLKYPIWVKTK